jgi:predicted ribosome quality control (RQC) complex YloA/Tae2 family protein
MTPVALLIGARIRRVDSPQEELLTLVLSGLTERYVLVFCFSTGAAGVGMATERPHGRAATSFVQKLRKELEGGRILALNQPSDASLELVVRHADTEKKLRCEFGESRVDLLDASDAPLARQSMGNPQRVRVSWPESIEQLLEQGPELLAQRAADSVTQRRGVLDKLIRTAHKRLERRLLALEQDMRRVEQVDPLRAQANLLMINLHAVHRGATAASLLDYTLDPPGFVTLTLDPKITPKQQVEAWFKQARRFERGAELARERTLSTHVELERFEALRLQLPAADEATLEQIAQAARALGVRGITSTQPPTASGKSAAHGGGTKRKQQPGRHKPYRELRGYKARTILVGKRAEDNDTLTREHARPHDLWLHVRDVPGAHVIVPLDRNETCPQELLLDAAHLAAHYSEARGEAIVDISYTTKRYIRKPKGAAPGKVQLEREKVLRLEPDPVRLRKLLSTEIQD